MWWISRFCLIGLGDGTIKNIVKALILYHIIINTTQFNNTITWGYVRSNQIKSNKAHQIQIQIQFIILYDAYHIIPHDVIPCNVVWMNEWMNQFNNRTANVLHYVSNDQTFKRSQANSSRSDQIRIETKEKTIQYTIMSISYQILSYLSFPSHS